MPQIHVSPATTGQAITAADHNAMIANTADHERRLATVIATMAAPSADTSGATDAAALAAAIAALGMSGTLRLRKGIYYVSAMITVPDGIGIVGEGNSLGGGGSPGTEIILTAVGAGISFNGSGGISGSFRVNANRCANYPFRRTDARGSQRTFLAMDVINARLDNITLTGAQNDTWLGVNVQGSMRDGLVLDNGAGGHLFSRCEFNASGRYGIRLDNAIRGSGYASPTHDEFIHCIIERPAAGASACVYQNSGDVVAFRSCIFQDPGTLSDAIIKVLNGTLLIDGGYAIGTTASSVALNVANGVVATIQGRFRIQNCLHAWNLASGCAVMMVGNIDYNNVASARYIGSGDPNQAVQFQVDNPVRIIRDNTSDFAWVTQLNSDEGYRAWMTAGGTLSWAPADYRADTTLARAGAGILKVVNVLVGTHAGTSLSKAGTFAFDSTSGNTVECVLSADCTSSTISGGVTGQYLTICFSQDQTGSRRYSWPTINIKYAGAAAPSTNTSVAFRRDSVTFEFNGLQWYEVSRAINVG